MKSAPYHEVLTLRHGDGDTESIEMLTQQPKLQQADEQDLTFLGHNSANTNAIYPQVLNDLPPLPVLTVCGICRVK